MYKVGGFLGVLGGLLGVAAAITTLFVGGVGSVFNADQAHTVVNLGWGGILFSFLSIIFGAVVFVKPRRAGLFLLISGIAGAILGGTLVAICMLLALVGGILAITGSPQIETDMQPSGVLAMPSKNQSKQKFSGVVLAAIIITVLLSALIANHYMKNDRPSETAESSEQSNREIYKTTAPQLFIDYESNEVAADERMKGKTIEVTGVVQSIDKDFTNNIIISLMTYNEFEPARMYVDDSQKQKALELTKGTVVMLDCSGMQRWVGSPSGKGCKFVNRDTQNASPSPPQNSENSAPAVTIDMSAQQVPIDSVEPTKVPQPVTANEKLPYPQSLKNVITVSDWLKVRQALAFAYSLGAQKNYVQWNNPKTGSGGSIFQSGDGADPDGCRQFRVVNQSKAGPPVGLIEVCPNGRYK